MNIKLSKKTVMWICIVLWGIVSAALCGFALEISSTTLLCGSGASLIAVICTAIFKSITEV